MFENSKDNKDLMSTFLFQKLFSWMDSLFNSNITTHRLQSTYWMIIINAMLVQCKLNLNDIQNVVRF